MSKEDVSARQVSGRYSLTEPLGRGGMGTVWAADDTLLKRRVAIKEVKLPPSIPPAERDAIKARATREARAAAQLSHPNVVTIFDVIEDDGTYIVMELVGAPTLAETVRESGPLNYRQAARIGLDVLDALEAAHAKGIIHRDVKPGNVMCPPGGRAKLADFGIASLKGDPKITTTGMIMGSPSFMAPEQATGQPTGSATDLWSLGATLYFATEGVPPFDRGQPIPTLTAVVHDDAPTPQGAGALGPVIAALMSKESEDRPDPQALRPMLVDVAEGRQADVSTEVFTPPPVEREVEGGDEAAPLTATPLPAPPPEPEPAPHEVPDRRGRGALIALGVAVLLLAGGLIFWGLQDDGPQGPPPRAEDNGGQDRGRGGGADEEPDIGPTETFAAGDTGYGVEVPEGWQERPQAEARIDLVDPETGDYLRVEWTDQPGDDALAAWETQASSFASSHANYQELGLESVDFQDSPTAALWEYSWSEGDTQLHAYNLGFVTGDGEYGFALNFVTDEDNWDESQPLWENFTATFGPS
ncbi:MAG: serine/threonine-protein kinase [Actinomycetota bacterium]